MKRNTDPGASEKAPVTGKAVEKGSSPVHTMTESRSGRIEHAWWVILNSPTKNVNQVRWNRDRIVVPCSEQRMDSELHRGITGYVRNIARNPQSGLLR